MDQKELHSFLEKIRNGKMSIDEGIACLRDLDYVELGFAKLDSHRELRVGCPEVIY